jgi:hypothetical protein
MGGNFAVFSQTQGPDGNGILLPGDPALGGHSGSGTTAASATAPVLLSGGFIPEDQQATTILAIVKLKTPQSGLPTASGSFLIKGEFIRNGNAVTQTGNGISMAAELPSALFNCSARFIVDTSVTPNQIAVQVKPHPGGKSPAIAWRWATVGPEMPF